MFEHEKRAGDYPQVGDLLFLLLETKKNLPELKRKNLRPWRWSVVERERERDVASGKETKRREKEELTRVEGRRRI